MKSLYFPIWLALAGVLAQAQDSGPSMRITSHAQGIISTSEPSTILAGHATSDAAIVRVYWMEAGGQRGEAVITPKVRDSFDVTWKSAPILFHRGLNQFTVVTVDARNRSAVRQVGFVPQAGGLESGAEPVPNEFRTGFWRGRVVRFEVINGFAVAEGDMILGRADEIPSSMAAPTPSTNDRREIKAPGVGKDGKSIAYTSDLWPRVNGVATIPYDTQSGSATTAVANAVASFNASLSGYVQYVARTAEANYVTFNLSNGDTSGACASSVGMVGGQQFITGSGSCGVSVLVHEMGHSIGLYHEHQRNDKANYITTTLANVDKPRIQGNFDAITSNAQDIGLYDYASVMHYFAYAFTKNGSAVLESIPSGIPLSNQVGYSIGDVDTIRRLYGFAPTQVTVTTNPPGLNIVVDGTTYAAPQTFSWAIGSTHTLNLPADPQYTNPNDGATYQFGNWSDLQPLSHSVTVTAGNGQLAQPGTAPAVTVYEANFIRLWPYSSSVFPAATGSVSPNPAPQSVFGGSFYTDRQTISLTATPNASYNFARWFGLPYPQGDNPKSYIVQSPVTAQGGFVNGPVTFLIGGPKTNPPLNATVDGSFTYFDQGYGDDGTSNFGPWTNGSSHTVVVSTPQSPVTTNVRYTFANWEDATTNTTRNVTASSSGVVNYTGTFTPVYRTFPLFTPYYSSYPTNTSTCAGSVDFSPASGDGFYADGTALTVTANAASGFVFAGWSGDLTGSTNPQNPTIHDQFVPYASFNTVNTPLAITGFSPSTITATAAAQDITVTGTGFTGSTVMFWNGSFRSSTFVNSTQITLHLSAGDLSTAGGQRVTAQNVANSCDVFTDGTFNVGALVTVGTNPSGNSFTVDGVTYTSTQTFLWTPASTHTLACANSTVLGPQCTGWSDGLPISHTVTAPSTTTAYTASFVTNAKVVDTSFTQVSLSGATAGLGCAAGSRDLTATIKLQNTSGTTINNPTGSLVTLTQGNTLVSQSWPSSIAPGVTATGTFNITLANCSTFQLFFDLIGQ